MVGMDANTARTQNMRRLIAEAGGPAEWSRKFGGDRWPQPQASQWISEASPKGIGGRLARDLEAAMGLSHGALDRAPSDPSHSASHSDETMAQALELLYLLADARPDDLRFHRPTWPMIKIAAKAIERTADSPRRALAEILSEIEKEN